MKKRHLSVWVACSLALVIILSVFAAVAEEAGADMAADCFYRQLDANQRFVYDLYVTMPREAAEYTVVLPEAFPDDLTYVNENIFMDASEAAHYDCPTKTDWFINPFTVTAIDAGTRSVTFEASPDPNYSEHDHELAMRIISAIAEKADPSWDRYTKWTISRSPSIPCWSTTCTFLAKESRPCTASAFCPP